MVIQATHCSIPPTAHHQAVSQSPSYSLASNPEFKVVYYAPTRRESAHGAPVEPPLLGLRRSLREALQHHRVPVVGILHVLPKSHLVFVTSATDLADFCVHDVNCLHVTVQVGLVSKLFSTFLATYIGAQIVHSFMNQSHVLSIINRIFTQLRTIRTGHGYAGIRVCCTNVGCKMLFVIKCSCTMRTNLFLNSMNIFHVRLEIFHLL